MRNVDEKKSVQVSTKGNRPNYSPVGPITQSKIKIAGIKTIGADKKDGAAKPFSKPKVKKTESKKAESKITKSIVLRKSGHPIIGSFDGDFNNLPAIVPELASIRPCDPKAFAILEQAILRDGLLAPLIVGEINGDRFLMDGHMRLECIIKHKITDYKIIVIDIPSIEAAIWWIIELSNTYRQLNLFQRIEMALEAEPYYTKLADENKRLAGKHKGALSKLDKAFIPIDCLKMIAGASKASRTTVSNAKFILKHGKPDDIEKCRQGKAINPVYKDVKEKRRKSKEYKEKHNAAYDGGKYENSEEGKYLNQIIQGDCKNVIRDMQFHGVKDVAALVTSSPYNVSLDYGPDVDDLLPHDEYIDNLAHLFYEASKLGRDGMRLINVFPQTTNKESGEKRGFKHSLFADLYQRIKELNKQYDDCNLLFWGHFNWYKNHSGGRACQGSLNCASPVLRFDSEYIGVWVKNTKKLENIHGVDCRPGKKSLFSDSDKYDYVITTEEYFKYTLQTWKIPPVSDHKYRHPARFPPEIPYRLIKLFTYPQDIILDPFCGSGTSCYVAKKLKRNYIGVDIVPDYCKISRDRLAELDVKEKVK